MPSNPYDEQGNPIQNNTAQDGGTVTSTAPAQSFGGNQGATPGAGNTAAADGSQRKGSGRFANLQAYVKANEGAGQQLGARVQNQTSREADQFKNTIQQGSAGLSSTLNDADAKFATGNQY